MLPNLTWSFHECCLIATFLRHFDSNIFSDDGLYIMTESGGVERRWDALIIELATRRVDTVAGHNLPENGSLHMDGPLQGLSGKLNPNYGMIARPAGEFKQGDVLPPHVEVFVF